MHVLSALSAVVQRAGRSAQNFVTAGYGPWPPLIAISITTESLALLA